MEIHNIRKNGQLIASFSVDYSIILIYHADLLGCIARAGDYFPCLTKFFVVETKFGIINSTSALV